MNLKKYCDRNYVKYTLLAIPSAVGGFLCGLTGIGGGILILPAFAILFSNQLNDRRDALACSLLSVMPMSFITAARYLGNGTVDAGTIPVFTIPALLGGCIGGLMLGKIGTKALKLVLAFIMLLSGLSMLLR